jgi:membrane fusion protein (multidrug efflux system)
VGALVQAGQPDALAIITRTDEVYVDVSQSADEMLNLRDSYESGDLSYEDDKLGDIQLILPNGRPHDRRGTMRFSDTIVDPTTGAVALRALFANPGGRLLPGMSVRTVLPEGTLRRAILVPQSAVTRDEKGRGVALVVGKADKLERRTVSADHAAWPACATGASRGPVSRPCAASDRSHRNLSRRECADARNDRYPDH